MYVSSTFENLSVGCQLSRRVFIENEKIEPSVVILVLAKTTMMVESKLSIIREIQFVLSPSSRNEPERFCDKIYFSQNRRENMKEDISI